MSSFSLIPVLVGAAAVIQAVLNRQLGQRWGLAFSVALNAAVLLVASATLLGVSRWAPARLPSFFLAPIGPRSFPLWFFLPGLLGLSIVAGLPWSIERAGAAVTFVLLIASQVVVSLVWDAAIEGRPVSWVKAAGALLVIAGAVMTTLGSDTARAAS
ncbi:MAG TPA: DMT family transporter [Myxococcaceae bacterium]|nr:DMT family transporter [Myxococcaceae bacterium]